MNVLVLNLGSSSLKYKLFTLGEKILSCGIVDQIGKDAMCRFDQTHKSVSCVDHQEAFTLLIDYLIQSRIIRSGDEIHAVGHRVVHGGEYYKTAVMIDQTVLQHIRDLFPLSPLHNPINYKGIVLSQKVFPHAMQFAVFDTAFYHTLPHKAFLYGIPYKYYRQYGIRKYGFHGISHSYISSQVLAMIKKKTVKHISCHLGNGSSITAIHNGKAVDTTMGFTPLQGVMMGTRSGNIDPAIIPFLEEKEHLSPKRLEILLNKKSGILGVSEISSDVRDIYRFFLEGDSRARLTLEMIAYQVTSFIGALAAVMGGVQVITFTGGIGENAFYIRKMALEPLRFLGVRLDETKNMFNKKEISIPSSRVQVYVLPTDEERQIYREGISLLR